MSTPTDEPSKAGAAAEPPAAPAVPPPAVPPMPPPPPPPPPPAATSAAFAPVPREPWVNPSRRTHIAGVGLIVALACLGAGIGIGLAISGDDHPDRPHGVLMVPGRGYFGPGMMYGPGGNVGVWPMPGGPYDNGGNVGSAPASPSPAPSSTG